MNILIVAFWTLVFFLILAILGSMRRCPKEGCSGKMVDVLGWEKERCNRCDFVQKI